MIVTTQRTWWTKVTRERGKAGVGVGLVEGLLGSLDLSENFGDKLVRHQPATWLESQQVTYYLGPAFGRYPLVFQGATAASRPAAETQRGVSLPACPPCLCLDLLPRGRFPRHSLVLGCMLPDLEICNTPVLTPPKR